MTDRNTFYIGTDDMFSRIVYRDGVAYDLSAVTKVAVCFDGTVYDSDDYADSFDWNTGTTGEIQFWLGKIDDISEFTVDQEAELLLYDATSPNGFVVGLLDIEAKEVA